MTTHTTKQIERLVNAAEAAADELAGALNADYETVGDDAADELQQKVEERGKVLDELLASLKAFKG